MFRVKFFSCALVLFLAVAASLQSTLPLAETCTSKGCKVAADYILESIDKSVDPCDDFYQFACGNAVKTQDDQHYAWETSQKLLELITELKLLTITDSSPFWHLKNFMDKCTNKSEGLALHMEFKYIVDFMDRVITGKPKIADSLTLESRATQLLPFGTDFLFDLAFESDQLIIRPHKFDIFYNTLSQVLTEQLSKEQRAFYDRSVELMSEEETRTITLDPQPDLPVNLSAYLSSRTNGDLDLALIPTITIENWKHFDFVMTTYKENKKLVLDYQVMGLFIRLLQVENGNCFEMANRELGYLVYALVADKYPRDFEKKVVIQSLISEFEVLLSNSSWILDSDWEPSIEGDRELTAVFAHQFPLLTLEQLADYYKDLNSTTDTFWELFIRVGQVNAQHGYKSSSLSELPILARKSGFFASDGESGNYKPNNLQVMFLLSYFMEPMAVEDSPAFVNLASVGVVVGREMGHWIVYQLGEDDPKVGEKLQCLEDQFDAAFDLAEYGKKTSLENLADAFGVAAAYSAAFRSPLNSEDLRILPGLQDYNIRQQFWLRYASMSCVADAVVSVDPRLRVNGNAQNSEDFSRDFQCASGTKMNPERRCSLF